MASIVFFVVWPSGHSTLIEMPDSSRIVDVKRKLRDVLESYPQCWRQHLIFETSLLGDDHTLAECRITNGCTLNIIIDVEDEEKEGMPDLESSSSELGDEEVHSDNSSLTHGTLGLSDRVVAYPDDDDREAREAWNTTKHDEA